MKRVLVVNVTQMGDHNGTANTLQNIFRGYPQEKMLQLIVTPYLEYESNKVRTIHTPISFCRIPYEIQLQRYKSRKDNGKGQNAVGAAIRGRGVKNHIHELMRGILDAWPIHGAAIYKLLDDFKPEIIYTCAASIRIMKTVYCIARHYQIPVVVHFMDDWPSAVYQSSFLSKPFHALTMHYLKKLYSLSDTNFAISEGLCEKYAKWSGKKHIPLMNPANIDVLLHSENQNETGEIRFLYAGSLDLKRDQSILDIADALEGLRKQGRKIRFDVYTAPKCVTEENQRRFAEYHVSLYPYVPVSEVYSLYAQYDVLVFTESFETDVIEFTKLSLSTKVPEYFAAQRAMLAYLPDELFSYRYLKNNDLACVAGNRRELQEACLQLIKNETYRRELAIRARGAAVHDFSYERTREKLIEVFGNEESSD